MAAGHDSKHGTRKDAVTNGGELATAAAEVMAEVLTFEALTARLARAELESDKQLDKSGELLVQAAQSHRRFVEVFRSLVEGVEDVRRRQNESAVALTSLEKELTARRAEYLALVQRFETLRKEAREVRALLAPEDGAPSGDGIEAARGRLTVLVEGAQALTSDAREAKLVDLEREGHALFQRLEALSRKLARVV